MGERGAVLWLLTCCNRVSTRLPMLQNPMIASAQAQLERAARRDERASRAYELLRGEFLDAFDVDPSEPVSYPSAPTERMPLVHVACDVLVTEDDLHTLAQMLRVVRSAADMEDPLAMSIVSSLSHRYAESIVTAHAEQGAFDE